MIDSVENDKIAVLVRRPAAAIILADPAPARHQHGRGRRRRASSCCRTFRAQLPAVGQAATCSSTARESIRESVDDVKFTLLLTLVLVVLVIFLFLRNVSATVIPSLALPLSIVGTFARHVPARLQPRQPLADGAHALGRLRRRRRDRDAREHRPPHGAWASRRCEAALDGLARDRLHDPLDDALARRGVHPGAVHGRASSAGCFHEFAVTICVGDPDLRLRLADADADAVQPLPAPARRTSSTAASTRRPSASSTACSAPTSGASRWVAAPPRRDASLVSVALLVATVCLFVRDPEGLHPERGHRPDLRRHRGRRRASRSTRWRGTSRRSPTIVRQDPNVAGLHRRASARAGPARRAQPGPHLHPPEAARERAARARRRHPGAAAEARPRSPASASSCRTRRRSASAASSRRACTSSRCRARTPSELYRAAPRARGEAARAARACRT